eukprot:4803010-Amphidinium_carterae.3
MLGMLLYLLSTSVFYFVQLRPESAVRHARLDLTLDARHSNPITLLTHKNPRESSHGIRLIWRMHHRIKMRRVTKPVTMKVELDP